MFLLAYIHAYGICIAVGAVLGIYYVQWAIKKLHPYLPHDDIAWNVFIISCLSGFCGGRILYLLMHESLSWHNFLTLDGGFSLLGSVGAVFCSLITYWHIKKLPWNLLFRIVPLSFLLVLFFGRIGCYFSGCCGGKILHFTLPLQLISAFCYGLFFLIGHCVTLKHGKQYPQKAFYGLLIFCCALITDRFLLDFFRNDRVLIAVESLFSWYQIITLLMMFIMISVAIKVTK